MGDIEIPKGVQAGHRAQLAAHRRRFEQFCREHDIDPEDPDSVDIYLDYEEAVRDD